MTFPHFKSVLIAIFLVLIGVPAIAQVCTGRFVNPISDICWDCLFPITIGSVVIASSPTADTANPDSPICYCPPKPVPGITAGFWEPVRLIDASRTPGCFSNLGGLQVELGSVRRGRTSVGSGSAGLTNMHVHYYHYPVWTLLEALIDETCLGAENDFDVAWVSELDPTWSDDKLAYILHPESILFGNIIAQAACTVDCVSASVGLPLTELFWCAGCQGSMYPMTGNITAHVGGVQASLLAAERLMYKLHRQLIAWGTVGNGALCGRHPMPIMNKRQYRFQQTQPTAQVLPYLGCNPTGRTTTTFSGLGGEYPIAGENFGYLLWRKRHCCMF